MERYEKILTVFQRVKDRELNWIPTPRKVNTIDDAKKYVEHLNSIHHKKEHRIGYMVYDVVKHTAKIEFIE